MPGIVIAFHVYLFIEGDYIERTRHYTQVASFATLRVDYDCSFDFCHNLYFITLSLSTVIEVLLFAISRQMIVGHVSGFEVLAGVAAIAGLFATHKYLYCKSLGDSDEKETVKDNTSEGKECK